MRKLEQPASPMEVTFTYDGNSFRRSLHDGSSLTKFHIAWKTGIPGIDPIMIETNVTDSTIAQYTHGLSLGTLSARRSGLSRLYHHEAIGSARQLTDSNQAITDTYIYEAFGRIVSISGTSTNPFKYVGQQRYYSNGGSGLMLLGRRYYNSALGRFDGEYVFSGSDNGYLLVWRTKDWTVAHRINCRSKVNSFSFSKSRSLLLATTENRDIMVWKLSRGNLHRMEGLLPKGNIATLSPDGKLLAVARKESVKGGQLKILKCDTGEILNEFKLAGHPLDIRFSHNGKLIAVSLRGQVSVWQSEGWQLRAVLDSVWATIDFSPDDKHMVISDFFGRKLTVWRVSDFKCEQSWDEGPRAVRFSQNGRRIAILGIQDLVVKDWKSNKKLWSTGFSIYCGASRGSALAWSPNGDYLLVGAGL